jgi:hypothetical protein
MTDDINADHVHVAADERRHPALQKLGRAFIALARDQLKTTADPMTDDVSPVPARATPPATNRPEATP